MANDLTDEQKRQLTSGGPCALHTHRVDLAEHRHLDSLQEIEVVLTVTQDHTVSYKEDIILADTTNNNITLTFPVARGGKVFQVLKTAAANTLTLQFSNGESLLGSTTVALADLGSTKKLKSIPGMYIPL